MKPAAAIADPAALLRLHRSEAFAEDLDPVPAPLAVRAPTRLQSDLSVVRNLRGAAAWTWWPARGAVASGCES